MNDVSKRLLADSRSLLLGYVRHMGCSLGVSQVATAASLLLVGAPMRQRELVVRTTLGARRGRFDRQPLIESLVLSLAGSALGAALGTAGVRPVLILKYRNLPPIGPLGTGVTLDWRVSTVHRACRAVLSEGRKPRKRPAFAVDFPVRRTRNERLQADRPQLPDAGSGGEGDWTGEVRRGLPGGRHALRQAAAQSDAPCAGAPHRRDRSP